MLIPVRNASQTVFAPTISPAAGVIVGEKIPGAAVRAIVFAYGSPGSFTKIRSPLFPVGFARLVVKQALMFLRVFHDNNLL
jgi:hypothetical protein